MRLKKYIECYIPTETCNLRCLYCYITQQRKFDSKLAQFEHDPKEIRLALSVNRLGGVCMLNFCAGGETLLGEEVIDVIKELLEEGHFLSVVTNGTLSARFDQIVKFPPALLERLFIKFSFHYLELLRTGLMDAFFKNIEKVRRAGSSFTVEITAADELIPFIEDIKSLSMDQLGVLPHLSIARDDRTRMIEILSDLSFEDYKKTWSDFESDLFDFKASIFYEKRKEFCYAGDWSLYINLATGSVRQCYCGKLLDNIYEDIEKPIHTEAIGGHCSLPHCYNGHAFLTLGSIPELVTPTYAQMRDRVDKMGRHWLQPTMRAFMEQKLQENNEEYSQLQKEKQNLKGVLFAAGGKFIKILPSIKNTIRRDP